MPEQQGNTRRNSTEQQQELRVQVGNHFERYLGNCQRIALGDLPVSIDLFEHSAEAPCVIFVPGIGTYSEYYCEYLEALRGAGFNCAGVDLRGHGYSGGRRGYYTMEQVVADLQLVVDYLEKRYGGPIGVVGCSIGARLGLALAEHDSRVRSLLCHTLFTAEFPPDIWHWMGWQGLAYTAFWLPDFSVDMRSFIDISGLMLEFPLGRYAFLDERMVWCYPVSTLHSVYSASSLSMQQDLGINAAVLIGADDRIIRPPYIEDLLKRTRQPFELKVVDAEGHMMPLTNADRMAAETRDWLQRTL